VLAGSSKQRSQKERPNVNSGSPVRQLPEPEIRQKRDHGASGRQPTLTAALLAAHRETVPPQARVLVRGTDAVWVAGADRALCRRGRLGEGAYERHDRRRVGWVPVCRSVHAPG